MKSVSRATWRAGEHLDSAVDFAIVLVMLLLDVCLPLCFQSDLLLLNWLLPIRPSWYHSLELLLLNSLLPIRLSSYHSLDLLLLNSLLPIRPSWYHSLDTNHDAPLPPHTFLVQSSHQSHGPNTRVGIQFTAYFLDGGNASAVYNNHGWCGVLLELLVFSFTNLQTTAMSPLLNSSFSYSITEYAMLGRRMETSSALIRIMMD